MKKLEESIGRILQLRTDTGKPSAKSAPTWAKYVGKTPLGAWYWLEKNGNVELNNNDNYFSDCGKTKFTGFIDKDKKSTIIPVTKLNEAKYAWENTPWDVIDTHHAELKVVKTYPTYIKAKIAADKLNSQHENENLGSMGIDQGVPIPRYGVQLAVVEPNAVNVKLRKESLIDNLINSITEELSGSARIRLKANMKRRSAVLTKRRAISSKKSASASVINHRAEKKAHDLIMNKKVLHGRDKTKMSPAEKSRIEGKMRAYAPAVKKLAKKMFSTVKAAGELRRHSAMTVKKP